MALRFRIALICLLIPFLIAGCAERRHYINYPYRHAVEIEVHYAPSDVIWLDWCEPWPLWGPGVTVWWSWYWYDCDPPADPPSDRTGGELKRTSHLRKPKAAPASPMRRGSLKRMLKRRSR